MITLERPDQQHGDDNLHRPDQDHHVPALPAGSIYSHEEALVLGPWQKLRQRVLSPVAFVLARLGISADMLSYTSVLLGLGFCLLAPFQFAAAFWLLVGISIMGVVIVLINVLFNYLLFGVKRQALGKQ